MRKLKIPYGKGYRSISLDDEITILSPHFKRETSLKDEASIIREALTNPVSSKPLSELSKDKENIVIITSDHTRPVPSRLTLPFILKEIRKGNSNAAITILIATGAHRETTRQELEDKFGLDLLENERFAIHHSKDISENVSIGIMPNGTELFINRIAKDADLLISEGFIEPHFFAGFSGGRKSVMPGIADARSVCANHCAKWIDHPKARTGILDGNPIHDEMQKAARLANLAFIFNVVLDENKKVIAAFAGHPENAHRKGCTLVSNMFAVSSDRSDIVVVGNGGYPLDQNIYQAVKGMTAAEAVCNDNGVIIMIAECSDGHGGKSFYEFFNTNKSIPELYDEILKTPSGDTNMDQWEAQILMRILKKHKVILVSALPRELVETFRLEYAVSFDEAYEMAKTFVNKEKPSICVIPDGVSVIIK